MKVHKSGFMTTVQDRGRFGQYAKGIPPSGAMDQYAYRMGNTILDNEENDAALELTMMGGEFEFQRETLIAVTGAEMGPQINDEAIPTWESVAVESGDVLEFTGLTSGLRTYVCVSGGIDVPQKFGSRSTYVMGDANHHLGGLDGRPLQDGDELPLFPPRERADTAAGRYLAEEYVPEYDTKWEVGFIFGFEDDVYTDEAKESFLDREWPVNNRSDRSAYRFTNDGDPLTFVNREQPYGAGDDPSNVVQSPYPVGGLHVPSGEEPILLLNDAVSFGGFATLGAVPIVDRNTFGQVKPGDTVCFTETTVDAAVQKRAAWKEQFTADNVRTR